MSWLIIHGAWIYVTAIVLAGVTAIFLSRKMLAKCINAGRTELLILVVIVLASWAVRQFLVFHTHNVYFDEFRHMELSRTLLHTGQFGRKLVAGDWESNLTRAVKWPPAFHCFLTLAFLIGDESEETGYTLNAIFGSLGVAGVWLFAKILSFPARSALLTAMLVSLWPLHLRMSGGISLEPGAAAFLLLASGLAVAFVKTRNDHLFRATAAAIGLAGLFRLESIAAALIIPGILAFQEKRQHGQWLRLEKSHYITLLILWTPILLHALAGFNAYRGFRAKNSIIPLWGGLSFWFKGGLMPYTYTALMLIGLVFLFRKRPALCLALCTTILGQQFVYVLYLRVDASYLDHQRYQLLCLPGVVGLMAAGLEWIGKSGKRGKKSTILLIIAFFVVFSGLIPGLPLTQIPFRTETEEEYRFILSSAHTLPQKAMYYAAVPSSLSTTLDVKCAPTYLLLEPETGITSNTGQPKIYFSDLWPLINEHFKQYDEEIRKHYILSPIVEENTEAGRIGFYKIIGERSGRNYLNPD